MLSAVLPMGRRPRKSQVTCPRRQSQCPAKTSVSPCREGVAESWVGSRQKQVSEQTTRPQRRAAQAGTPREWRTKLTRLGRDLHDPIRKRIKGRIDNVGKENTTSKERLTLFVIKEVQIKSEVLVLFY